MTMISTTVSDLKSASEIVKECLEQFPETRNSDDFLYLQVCKRLLWSNGMDIYKLSAIDLLTRRKELNLPSYETVRRTRQKLQEKDFCKYGADPDVEAARELTEEEYRKFVRF